MASQYGYATVASLELFASEDYGLIDATFLTDAHVEAKITAGEQLVNTYTGKTYTAPFPDGIVYCTHDIAKRLLYQWMREHGMKLDKEKVLQAKKPIFSKEIVLILDMFKTTKVSPVRLHRLYNNDPSVHF